MALYHVSNRHVDLAPVLATAARDLGAAAGLRSEFAVEASPQGCASAVRARHD